MAVSAFLESKIRYLDIHKVISMVMDKIQFSTVKDIQDVYETDRFARECALKSIKSL